MAHSLTITSTSFPDGGLIPVSHKNATSCGEANISPQLSWTTGGDLLPSMVEKYEMGVWDPNSGNFLHWRVEGIDPTQLSIAENGAWIGTPIITPSGWGTGDAANGWNGPCAQSSGANVYNIQVRAYILPEYQDFLKDATAKHGVETVESPIYTFIDNNINVSPPPTIADCDQLGCDPGSELVDEKCQTITSIPVTIGATVYTAAAGDTSLDYGKSGTRFYEDADAYIFPLNGDDATSELFDNDGAGIILPYTVINTDLPPWDHAGVSLLEGRLNIAGLWTTEPGIGMPTNEWIGFSTCITVPSTGKYSIGLGADNRMRFSLNGVLIAHFDTTIDKNHKYWHVIEMNLNEGLNIIEMEGYNSGSNAAFGAEIYNTDIATLKLLASEAALEPYIEWSTRDRIGNDFNVGEVSGYTCPEGTAYDSCAGGQCTSITYSDPTAQACCWLIENCKDPEETYLIHMDAGETEVIYNQSVYAFGGHAILLNKCFTVIELALCPIPDLADVTVTATHGVDNCMACDPSIKLESCLNPGEFTYVSMDGDLILIEGNIYELDQLEGCQIYVGTDSEHPPSKTDVIVVTDYEADDCLVCIPCYEFRNCDTGVAITVRFAEGFSPNEDDFFVYGLAGDPALEDICWQLAGEASCPGLADYEDVTIVKDYECANCETCIPYYKLTNCIDPEDIMFIQWGKLAPPLTPGTAYIFDFTPNPDECYTAELQFGLCPDSELIPIP